MCRSVTICDHMSQYKTKNDCCFQTNRGCDLDVYVEMNLNLRRSTQELDAHELSVRKVDVTAQVLRTIAQVFDFVGVDRCRIQ